MFKIGIILDHTVDQFKVTNLFKDASNVSLSFMDASYKVTKDSKVQISTLKTSEPNKMIESINAFYTNKVDHILILTSPEEFTNTYEQAKLAKAILKDEHIDILDTKTFGPGILYVLMCIKRWLDLQYSYIKVIGLLQKHIEQGTTLVVTRKSLFDMSNIKTYKFLKPFIKTYILNSNKHYEVTDVTYRKQTILNKIYQQIKGLNQYHKHATIYVYGGMDIKNAKLLQHELYTKDKTLGIYFYGSITEELSEIFGRDAYGIYLGYYEEETI